MTISEKQEINDATGNLSEKICHSILFDTTMLETNFLTSPMLTLNFFSCFFIIILKHILRNTNFDHCVISVGTQDQLLLCIQLN